MLRPPLCRVTQLHRGPRPTTSSAPHTWQQPRHHPLVLTPGPADSLQVSEGAPLWSSPDLLFPLPLLSCANSVVWGVGGHRISEPSAPSHHAVRVPTRLGDIERKRWSELGLFGELYPLVLGGRSQSGTQGLLLAVLGHPVVLGMEQGWAR